MFIIAGAMLATAAYSENRRRAGQKKARKQQKKDEAAARKAEAFAETEDEGIGSLGNVNLEVDRDLEEDRRLKSNLRI